jgi:hypothetical protein
MSDADLDAAVGGRLSEDSAETTAAPGTPLIVAFGIGGRIELTPEQIRMTKRGVFGHAVELLWLGYGITEKIIPVRTISSVEIVTPLLMPSFIRFSYPGSPRQTDNYIDDALAENSLLMGWFDNRAFYRIKAWIERWPDRAPP